MSWLERLIRQRLEQAQETLLGGQAPNYETYVAADTRYRVLREMLDDLKARNDAIARGEAKLDDDD